MMDFLSSFVPLNSVYEYFVNMLCSIVARSQLLGGPDRARMTAPRFQWMPPAGF
jgi:hypothetical protein